MLTTGKQITRKDSQRLDYLDGWRGLAIALVLEGHFINILPLGTGRMGVDIFFCLSGFLMSGILFQQRQPLNIFYKRRISRIVPAFVVFVVYISIFSYIYIRPLSASEFISTLLFLRTYIPAEPGIWGSGVPLGHLWSLNVEEHCYVFMTLLILSRRLRGYEGWLLFISGIGCILIGILYVKLGSNAPRWGALGTEVVASHLLISAGYRLLRDKFAARVPSWLPILTLTLAIICYSDFVPWWCHPLLTPFLFAFTVNHLSDTALAFRSILSSWLFKYLGIWSFSIYLWQQLFYHYKTSIPGGSTIALAGAISAALVSFYVIERPSRAWLNKNW